jgi:hypothetical protein
MSKKALLAMMLVLILPAAGFACGIEAWNFVAPAISGFTIGNWTFGEVFVANQDIRVSYLGYYTQGFPPNFLSTHPVGMFDANGDLLASTVISNNSYSGDPYQPVIGGGSPGEHFAYNWIPQITLLAGQTYVLEGVSGADPYTWNDYGFQVYSAYVPITILGNNWTLSNGLNFIGTFLISDVSDGYWGPSFGISPEPSTFVLLATGVLGLAAGLRRKLNM